jgi:hypothetical protein
MVALGGGIDTSVRLKYVKVFATTCRAAVVGWLEAGAGSASRTQVRAVGNLAGELNSMARTGKRAIDPALAFDFSYISG